MKQRIITSVIALSLLATMPAWGQTSVIKRKTASVQKTKVQTEKAFVKETFTIDGLLFDTYEYDKSIVQVYADKENKPKGNLVIPESVTYKGKTYKVRLKSNAFSRCEEIVSVIIPEGIEFVSPSAFEHCTNLSSVKLPNSLKGIDYSAFESCKSLKSIDLPEGLTSIRDWVFAWCENLSSINFPKGANVGDGVFAGCENLSEPLYNEKVFAKLPFKYKGQYTIPEGIKEIAKDAFSGSGVTTVTIPESVEKIGSEAFRHCDNLTYLFIPNSVKDIGILIFNECHYLTEISIPSHLVGMFSSSEFGNCRNLKCVTVRYQDGTEQVLEPEDVKSSY